MIIGSSNSTPYDLPATVGLCLVALVLLVGSLLGPSWTSTLATVVRWGAIVLAGIILATVHLLTPTPDGIVGAARLLMLWPTAAATLVLFLVWTWRVW